MKHIDPVEIDPAENRNLQNHLELNHSLDQIEIEIIAVDLDLVQEKMTDILNDWCNYYH